MCKSIHILVYQMKEEKSMVNMQIYPSKVRVVPNVKLIKNITEFDAEDYHDILDGYQGGVIEKRNHKKFGDVITTYKITNTDGYDDESPLTEMDATVLSACISEQKVGNEDTTSAIILRALTGKVGESGDHKPRVNQREAILHSITKLMQTIIDVDLSEANKALDYNNGKPQRLRGAILPCKFITTIVNGQPVDDVIYFLDESPVMKIAEQRNQILRYDTELLDVPGQNNTPLVIVLKNYVMRRIAEIKLHNMTPTLTFADIFKRARISDANKHVKFDARNTVEKFFAHLQEKDVVKNFELVKRGNQIHAVKFAF